MFDYKGALFSYEQSKKQIAFEANERWQAFCAKEKEINARDNKYLEAQRLKFFSNLRTKLLSPLKKDEVFLKQADSSLKRFTRS